jgi:hypothetical protein
LDVPEPPAILFEDRVQDRLVELVVIARVTVPVNPFKGATEIMEVPATLTSTATLVGLADTAKS